MDGLCFVKVFCRECLWRRRVGGLRFFCIFVILYGSVFTCNVLLDSDIWLRRDCS